jgi:hypothetical protein
VNPEANAIGKESVGAAADLVEFFKAQAARVAPLLVRKRLTQHERCEREIRRLLAGGKVLTKREVQRYSNAPATIFNDVFQALLEAEQLEETEKPGEKGTRKAFRLFEEER